MKVLTVAVNYLPIMGGISNHIHYLNKALTQNGVDITLLQIIENSNKEDMYFESISDFDISLFRVHIRKSINLKTAYYYRGLITALIENNFPDIDLIHLHEFKKTEWLFYKNKFKWVWTNHTSFFVEMIQHKTLKKTLLKNLMKIIYSDAKAVISVSGIMNKLTNQLLPRHRLTSFISNGVDIKHFEITNTNKFTFPKNKTVVLIPARWDHIKGIHTVVNAMKEMTKLCHNFLFVFAGSAIGDINYRYEISEKLEGLNNYITYENISYEDMPDLYSAVDIVLLPSLFETGGIVPLEAMANKTIVLATRVGNIPYLIQHGQNGFLFESENVTDLIDKLMYIEEHQKECQNVIMNGYRYVFDYDWDNIAKKTISLYKKVICE